MIIYNKTVYTLTNDKIGSIRVIEVCGKPWFIIKDVFSVLMCNDYRQLMAKVDATDMQIYEIDKLGRSEVGFVVSERGLFTILDRLMAATLKGVVEGDDYLIETRERISRFQKWILDWLSSESAKKYSLNSANN